MIRNKEEYRMMEERRCGRNLTIPALIVLLTFAGRCYITGTSYNIKLHWWHPIGMIMGFLQAVVMLFGGGYGIVIDEWRDTRMLFSEERFFRERDQKPEFLHTGNILKHYYQKVCKNGNS